jgi:hypothetical protein
MTAREQRSPSWGTFPGTLKPNRAFDRSRCSPPYRGERGSGNAWAALGSGVSSGECCPTAGNALGSAEREVGREWASPPGTEARA